MLKQTQCNSAFLKHLEQQIKAALPVTHVRKAWPASLTGLSSASPLMFTNTCPFLQKAKACSQQLRNSAPPGSGGMELGSRRTGVWDSDGRQGRQGHNGECRGQGDDPCSEYTISLGTRRRSARCVTDGGNRRLGWSEFSGFLLVSPAISQQLLH